MFQLKRVYDDYEESDGARFLVERLWPRGIKKTELHMKAWAKEVAPSTELRRWFSHDPLKWKEFQHRYQAELQSKPEAWQPLLEAGQHGKVTLLFSSHDTEHNNALVLKSFLEHQKKN